VESSFSSINKLQKKRRLGSSRFNFNAQLDMGEIETFEKAYALEFSDSYKQFMSAFNGGMMLEFDQSCYMDMTDWEPDGPKWSSFYFHTLDELGDQYSDLKSESGMFGKDYMGIFPIIPICSTPKQETIMVLSQKGLSKESPVFISNDVSDMNTYIQIYDNFHELLNDIVDHDGFPDIKIEPGSQLMSIFIYDSGITKTEDKEETTHEVIERTSAFIKLNPKSSWSYCDRGNAYLENGQRKNALSDYNKAIEMNNEESFFYYLRGKILLNYGSKRKALIDLDIAAKLDPDNLLFTTHRADALHQLGKLDKALIDCNMVLEKDYTYILALNVRYKVYGSMGKDELAQADLNYINELI